MIKFFRKTRFNLMEKNKTGKYFKYAIGEIILVVIGILIALQINNWNEERKEDKAEDKALVALKNEFEKNIKLLQFICEQRSMSEADKRAYYDLITNDTIPIETKAKGKIKGFFGGSWAVQNTVLNGLVNSGKIDNIKNDTLKMLLTEWPNRVQRWNDEEDKWYILKQKFKDYLRPIKRISIPRSDNKNWENILENDVNEDESRMASIVNELEYQNFISAYIRRLYIQSMQCDKLMEDYNKIINSLNIEIKTRKIN
jgi:hypothetical protein